jgi:hypothetical protein
MDMNQASVFLAGSILTMLGFIVVVAGVIVINNLIHKYWKPVKIFSHDSWFLNPPQAAVAQREDHERHQLNRDERIKE